MTEYPDLPTLLDSESFTIVLSEIAKARKLPDSALRLFALRAASELISGDSETVPRDELLVSMQAFPAPVTGRQVAAAIRQLRFLSPSGKNYKILPTIRIGSDKTGPNAIRLVDTREFLTWLKGTVTRKGGVSESPSLRECGSAIAGTFDWSVRLTQHAFSNGFVGIPVYWGLDNSGAVVAQGAVPASCATIDTGHIQASILLGSVDVDDRVRKDTARRLGRLWAWVMGWQITESKGASGADLGGVYFPDDDDFPGARHPTVEATGDAVCLADSIEQYFVRKSTNSEHVLVPGERREFIRMGVDFLLRMQLDSGAWGVYRFQGGKVATPPSANSCRYAVLGLTSCLQRGYASPQQVLSIRRALTRFLNFAQKTAIRRHELAYWTWDFSDQESDKTTIMATTGRILEGLLAAYPYLDESRGALTSLVREGVDFLQYRWKPDPGSFTTFNFRVPVAEGFDEDQMAWREPTDVEIVYVLEKAAGLLPMTLQDSTGAKIEVSVLAMLASQVKRSFWVADLDTNYASPPNSFSHTRTLNEYLEAELRALRKIIRTIE